MWLYSPEIATGFLEREVSCSLLPLSVILCSLLDLSWWIALGLF
jgi:hypothetical protein